MATITVTAKDNLGHSPKFGDIVKGQQYQIEETDFAIELFDPPEGFDITPYLPKPADAVTTADTNAANQVDANQFSNANQEVL